MPATSASAPLLPGRFQHAFALASQVHDSRVRQARKLYGKSYGET
jgi:hypothetical protein